MTRLSLEQLGHRDVPATLSLSGGTLTITGTDYRDVAEVTFNSITGKVHVTAITYRPDATGPGQGVTASYAPGVLQKVVFHGGDGDDEFSTGTTIPCELNGGADDDRLFGGSGNDVLFGGTGDDDLYGGGGNDDMTGYTGNDYLHGGWGDDFLNGMSGNDTIVGGYGNDTLYGGTGTDEVLGGPGNDYLDGGVDGVADRLVGGSGADTFKREMYWDVSQFEPVYVNRDTFVDYSPWGDGDVYVG